MREVKKDEGEENDAAHAHGAGSVGGLHDLVDGIAFRAGAAVVEGERNRHPYVHRHTGEQEESDAPKRGSWEHMVQFIGVGVDDVRPEENLEIPQHMTHHKQDENQSGQGHQNLATNRGFKKTAECDHNVRNLLISGISAGQNYQTRSR